VEGVAIEFLDVLAHGFDLDLGMHNEVGVFIRKRLVNVLDGRVLERG